MSLLHFEFGRDKRLADAVKLAAAAEISMSMAGRLYLSSSGWLLLNVPNALMRGVFDTIQETGIELPPKENAHISVMSEEEVNSVGADKISERGHMFRYTLGPLRSVKPAGWADISKVWFVEVKSPELKKLRASYGLTPLMKNNQHEFHITVAVRKSNVLRSNDVSKAAQSNLEQSLMPSLLSPNTHSLADFVGEVSRRTMQGVRNDIGGRRLEDAMDPAGRWRRMMDDMQGRGTTAAVDRIVTGL